MLRVVASVNAKFETSVGVIHRVNETNQYVVRADRGGPSLPPERFRKLVSSHLREATELNRAQFEREFDEVTIDRFGQTETEYNEWMTDRVREIHTTTIQYTGGNNVTYTKECEPKQSDVQIQSVTPVYLPKVTHRVPLGKYDHTLKYAVAGAARETITSPKQCVHCGDNSPARTHTYCANCGSINCPTHTKTERLQGTPVCTGCAVTDSFFRSTKYFYDERNLETFRQEYEQMPVYEKAQENIKLAAGIVAGSLFLVISLLGLLISMV
jgi:restriction endonuclease Mrr